MTTAMLVPCGGCRRHVRASEPSCPFCATPLSDAAGEGIVPEPAQRMSRAGVLAFAAAFLSTACNPQSNPTRPEPAAADSGIMATIYGGPPVPPPPPPTPPPNLGEPSAPAYGGPPPTPPTPPTPPATPDAGSPSHHTHHAHPEPIAVPVPAYGIAPRPQRPGGSISTRYGSPPRPFDDTDG